MMRCGTSSDLFYRICSVREKSDKGNEINAQYALRKGAPTRPREVEMAQSEPRSEALSWLRTKRHALAPVLLRLRRPGVLGTPPTVATADMVSAPRATRGYVRGTKPGTAGWLSYHSIWTV